jgi:membrane-associated phospholipid phosphatase
MHGFRVWAVSIVLLFIATIGASAQNGPDDYCSFPSFIHAVGNDGTHFLHGLQTAPRDGLKANNLVWELPIGAVTGVLITRYDVQEANRIQSTSLQNTAGRWSNIGVGMEVGSAALAFALGCKHHNSRLSTAGFKMLDAMGAAAVTNEALKFAFNRQYAYASSNHGEFWEGGKSFPSGHAAVSFAFASALAHEYPDKRWVKWGAYALAAGISLSRLPAKKHFPSDVLIGGTVGYVVGDYIVSH